MLMTMLEISGSNVFHATNFAPIRSLCEDKFGDGLRTSAKVACLFLAMLYKHEYCSLFGFPTNFLPRK